MSLFARRRGKDEERASVWPGYPFPPSQFAGRTTAGVNVTLESYTRSAAASACVRVLVSTVKKLPVDVVRYDGDIRRPMATQPQIVASPSAMVSRRGWVAQVMRSACTAGNAYGDITEFQGATIRPATIETIKPGRVTWDVSSGEWVCKVDGKRRDVWPHGDLWHMPASDFLPPGQPFALSPVELAATSIGTSIAAEDFGAQFFGDGAHPSSLIYSDSPLTAPQAQDIKDAFMSAISGTRAPAVFGSGLKYQTVQVSPSDTQFIDLLRFEVEQACRFWGVPPSMVYAAISGQNVTYTNATQADLAFLKHSVDNWIVDIEDTWSSMIPAPQQVKFNTSALLRMDDEARWKIHDLRLKNKTTSVNKVLKLEDELPFPDPEFDKPGIPGGEEKIAKPTPVAPPPADPTGTAT